MIAIAISSELGCLEVIGRLNTGFGFESQSEVNVHISLCCFVMVRARAGLVINPRSTSYFLGSRQCFSTGSPRFTGYSLHEKFLRNVE